MMYRVTCTEEYDCAFEVEANSQAEAERIAYERMNQDDHDQREFAGTSNWQTQELTESEVE